MIVCNVVGPFRGPTVWDIAENVRRAERVGLIVAQVGMMPIIPHANTHLFHGQLSDEFWIRGTLEFVRRADMLAVLPGWESSEGTRGEIIEAERLGKPIVYLKWWGEFSIAVFRMKLVETRRTIEAAQYLRQEVTRIKSEKLRETATQKEPVDAV